MSKYLFKHLSASLSVFWWYSLGKHRKMTAYDLKFDYRKALKRENFTQSQIDVFRESVKSCAKVPKSLTNKQVCKMRFECRTVKFQRWWFQLLVVLHACDGDVIKATQMMKKHYEIRQKTPQLFTRRDATLPEIQQCLENQQFVNLPSTPNNHLVCLHSLTNSTAKNYNYNPSTTCFLMMIRMANAT